MSSCKDCALLRPQNMPPRVWAAFSAADWSGREGARPRTSLYGALGAPRGLVTLCEQTHGDGVAVVTRQTAGMGADDNAGRIRSADALVTDTPGAALCILTADCVPVLLADTAHGAIGAIHSGWRGTAADIVGRTLEAMAEAFGSRPADVVAAIGPHIGPRAYAVGEDVTRAIGREFASVESDGLWHMDLGRAVAAQLRRRGVAAVEDCGVCTFEDERFPSYRRDKTTRRIGSVIALN